MAVKFCDGANYNRGSVLKSKQRVEKFILGIGVLASGERMHLSHNNGFSRTGFFLSKKEETLALANAKHKSSDQQDLGTVANDLRQNNTKAVENCFAISDPNRKHNKHEGSLGFMIRTKQMSTNAT